MCNVKRNQLLHLQRLRNYAIHKYFLKNVHNGYLSWETNQPNKQRYKEFAASNEASSFATMVLYIVMKQCICPMSLLYIYNQKKTRL